jgi:conjugal transfer/entry exclusion protein
MPNLRTFEYVEVFQNAQQIEPQINLDEKFVTRAEFESIQTQYEEIINKLKEMNEPKKRVKGVDENESVV